ncbi:hypothetical protein KNP414_03592 [Paenibacillus mucilaginosus KNP414]|uniref:Uncharacterized protein n=1 Tax=Paenibacillus mucilaginosus (strain KNP414) TaxID=1036673 RepID=F8FDG6_PAEMK|nr:hypothetical protein KNP414_03592 [Paenibacillus mucilaginosus KNP414]
MCGGEEVSEKKEIPHLPVLEREGDEGAGHRSGFSPAGRGYRTTGSRNVVLCTREEGTIP